MTEIKELKRMYNIPLRKEFQKAPMHKRSKKAIKAIKEFLIRHMKPATDDKGRIQVKLGQNLNMNVWDRGIKRPPHHVAVNAARDNKGLVTAELVGHEFNEGKVADIKKEGIIDKVKSKVSGAKKTAEPKLKAEAKEDVKTGKVAGVKVEEPKVKEPKVEEPKVKA